MKKFALIWLLCLVLVLAVVGCGDDDDQTDLQMGVSALISLADEHINGYVDSLQKLAVTSEVQSADWQQMADLLAGFQQNGDEAIVWFALPDGSYYTEAKGLADQTLSDRDYFPKLMVGDTVVGTLVVSKSTGRKATVVAVPVINQGKVIGGLGTSIFLDDLSNSLSQQLSLPNDRVFYALDETNTVALSSDTSLIMEQNIDIEKDVEWQTSPLTGWRFGISETEPDDGESGLTTPSNGVPF